MVVLQLPKHVLAGLHVVMGHVEHVSCREEAGRAVKTFIPECLFKKDILDIFQICDEGNV